MKWMNRASTKIGPFQQKAIIQIVLERYAYSSIEKSSSSKLMEVGKKVWKLAS